VKGLGEIDMASVALATLDLVTSTDGHLAAAFRELIG
jgi:hypothetical protein